MENLETLEAFGESVEHFKSIFRVEPGLIACDLHPGYLSAKWAAENALKSGSGVPVVQVQHHHAHIAALMAEHGLDGSQPVIGFSFDGTGYGTDGAIWGGEVLIADYRGFERAAHLAYTPLAGGDARSSALIARRWRSCGRRGEWNRHAAGGSQLKASAKCCCVNLKAASTVFRPAAWGGFDAVASLIGVRQSVTYEGQAAIEMESLAATDSPNALIVPIGLICWEMRRCALTLRH